MYSRKSLYGQVRGLLLDKASGKDECRRCRFRLCRSYTFEINAAGVPVEPIRICAYREQPIAHKPRDADHAVGHAEHAPIAVAPLIKHILFTCVVPMKMNIERDAAPRSEEHTSELQSRGHLVCRLLLEKKNNRTQSA